MEIVEAIELYRMCREMTEATRDLVGIDDELDWAREDLLEASLEVKLAIADLDRRRINLYSDECLRLLIVIRLRVRWLRENGEIE